MTSRLPTPGGDTNTWGDILNDFLLQSHNSDGTLKAASVGASQVQDGSLPSTKLDTSTQTTLSSVSGKEPAITAGSTSQYWRGDKSWQTLDKSAVGLSNVDNTADTSKPVSTAQAAAIDAKPSIAVYSGSAWPTRPTASHVTWIDTSGTAPTPTDIQAGDVLITKT